VTYVRAILATLALGICCLGVTVARADARPKTDVVELLNGDRITCEITKLQRGQLIVKTDDMGTIYVEWDNVRAVTSSVLYEVEVRSGQLYFGTLRPVGSRTMEVVNTLATARLSFEDIVRAVPVEDGFWKRLEGSIDSGFSFSQSLEQTQLTLNTSVTHRRRAASTQLTYGSALTTQEDAERQTRNDISLVNQRTFRPRWSWLAFGQGQQNEQLSLNFRTVLGGGLARMVAQSSKTELAVFGGAAYTNEQYKDEDGRSVGEFVAGTQFSWFTYDNRSTNFSTSLYTFYGFAGEKRFRTELSAQFKAKIVGDLYWSASLAESYTSKPPNGNPKNDMSISATIGWTF
jgi:hypothetical protein